MEDSLRILWLTFSAVWVLYLGFVVALSLRQKRVWEQVRDLRTRLGGE